MTRDELLNMVKISVLKKSSIEIVDMPEQELMSKNLEDLEIDSFDVVDLLATYESSLEMEIVADKEIITFRDLFNLIYSAYAEKHS